MNARLLIFTVFTLMCSAACQQPTFESYPKQASEPSNDVSSGKTRVLAFSKSKVIDPVAQQQRAFDAVNQYVVPAAMNLANQNLEIEAINELVMDQASYNPSKLKINVAVIRAKLKGYATKVSSQDTVIIYSHGHGSTRGMILTDGINMSQELYLPWTEYANLILDLPAKNIIVFTQACYSGSLVEVLNQDATLRAKMEQKKALGKNFAVVTVQNSTETSSPVTLNGVVINPLTEAVKRAFLGTADGYEGLGAFDKKMTFAELVNYVKDTTGSLDLQNNRNHPQATGSYQDSALAFGVK